MGTWWRISEILVAQCVVCGPVLLVPPGSLLEMPALRQPSSIESGFTMWQLSVVSVSLQSPVSVCECVCMGVYVCIHSHKYRHSHTYIREVTLVRSCNNIIFDPFGHIPIDTGYKCQLLMNRLFNMQTAKRQVKRDNTRSTPPAITSTGSSQPLHQGLLCLPLGGACCTWQLCSTSVCHFSN